MSTINGYKRRNLSALGYTGSLNDMWLKFLRTMTGRSTGDLNDLEVSYLGGANSLADRWKTFLRLNGISNTDIDDALSVFWSTTGAGALVVKNLYTAGDVGVWYDLADFAYMFQDSTGTTPITALGQPVGRVLDKSGNSINVNQATSTARGILGTGLIDFDGVDDLLLATSGGGGTTGFFLCTAVRPDGGAGTNRVIFSDAGVNTGYVARINTSNQLELAAGNGVAYTLAATTATLSVGTTYVATLWDDGVNINAQLNNGTVTSVARPVVSAGGPGFTIGRAFNVAASYFNGAIYSSVYVKNGQTVDATERLAVKNYIANKAGVTL